MASISNIEVRQYIADSVDNNHLIDGIEFSDTRIDLAKRMAVDSYNNIPPLTQVTETTLRSSSVLLYGTLWHLFVGQAALAARNQMSYSDGGLTIPIEERYQYYLQLAEMYQGLFTQSAKDVKIAINMEAGWGSVSTDYGTFPVW